ncbi:hypothetical protein HYH02_006050 [Chlamydomonas schloesseri]|uniref:Uncharacterized protein n=1 Tax=Chlamydomonas schloesseri TaxID=2026947 RepID=A0A835WJ84_9CHLO|nr:hypothetical protein HYH02_006050 [Chlamydomonas schloesseri]|eukprot:KAG2448694.1 hypothetical protein HYH02_006050 [Chlamydomonas schloesseri]
MDGPADTAGTLLLPGCAALLADDVGVESLPPLPAGIGCSPMRLSMPGNGAGRNQTISFTPDTADHDSAAGMREGASQRELNAVSLLARVGSLRSLAIESVVDEPVHSACSSASFRVAVRPTLIKEASMKPRGLPEHKSNNVGGEQLHINLSPLPQPQKLSNNGSPAPSLGLNLSGAGALGGTVLVAAPVATLGTPTADLRARRISAPGQYPIHAENGPHGTAAQPNFTAGGPAVIPAGRFGSVTGGSPKKGFLFVEEDEKGGNGVGRGGPGKATGKAAVAALKARQEAEVAAKGGMRDSASGEASGTIYSVPPIPTAEWFDLLGADGARQGPGGGMCGCFGGGGGQIPPQVAQQRKWWRARLHASLQAADDEEMLDWIAFHNSRDGPARDAPELSAVLWLSLELPQPGAAPQFAKLLLRGGASPNAPRPTGPPGPAAAAAKAAPASHKGAGGSLGPGGVNWLAGLTPLMRAAELASPALVEVLLEAGADAAATQPGSGLTALHRALLATPPEAASASRCATPGVKSAIKKFSADVSASGDLESLPAYRCARLLLDALGLQRARGLRAAGGAAGSSAGVNTAGDFGLVRFARRHGRVEAARWLLSVGLEDEPEPAELSRKVTGEQEAAAEPVVMSQRPGMPSHAATGPKGGTDSSAAPMTGSSLVCTRNSFTSRNGVVSIGGCAISVGGGAVPVGGGAVSVGSGAISVGRGTVSLDSGAVFVGGGAVPVGGGAVLNGGGAVLNGGGAVLNGGGAAPSPAAAGGSKRSLMSTISSKRLTLPAEPPGGISLFGVAARASADGRGTSGPLLHTLSSNGRRAATFPFGDAGVTSSKKLLHLHTGESVERNQGMPMVQGEEPETQAAKLQGILDAALRSGCLEPLEEVLALPHVLTQAATPPNSGMGSGGATTEALSAAATAASHLASIANGRLEVVRRLLASCSSSAPGGGDAVDGAAAAVRYYLVSKATVLEAAAAAHGRAVDFYTVAGRQSEAVDSVLAAKQREAQEYGPGEELAARCQAAVVRTKTTRDTVVAALEKRRDAHVVAVEELLEKRLLGLSDASKVAETQVTSMVERMVEALGVEVKRLQREIEDARHEAASRMMMLEGQLSDLAFRKQMQMARDSPEARAAFNTRMDEYRKSVQAQRKALQRHLDDAARALELQSKRATTRAKAAGGWRTALSKRQQALAWEARNTAGKIKEAIAARSDQLMRSGRIPHLLLTLSQLGGEVARNATTASTGVNKTVGALLARASEARQSLGGWVTVGRQEMQEHLTGLVTAHSKALEQIIAAGAAGVSGVKVPRMPPAPDTARNLQNMDAASGLREYDLRDVSSAEGEARSAAAAALLELPRQVAAVDQVAEEVVAGCNEQIRDALPDSTLVDALSLSDFGPLLDHAAEELLGPGLEALLVEEMGLKGGVAKVELQLPTLNMDELVKPLDLNLADVDQGTIHARSIAGDTRRAGWADGGGSAAGGGGMPPPGYGMPPPGYGMPPLGYGMPPLGYGMPPPGYGMPPPGYGMPPPGYGMPPPGYGMPPPGYGMPPPHAAWGGWYGPPHHGYGHHKGHESEEDEVMSDGGNRHGGNKDNQDWGMSYS